MKNIIIVNKDKFSKTISNLKKDGLDNLYILADFDRTLTYSKVNGEKRPSLISVLRHKKYLSEEYSIKAYELFNKYNPIEINPNVPLEEKSKQMNIWWSKHLELLIKSGLNKEHVKKVVNSGIIVLRNKTKKFFNFTKDNKIPIVIISANGLGKNSIKLYLKGQNNFHKNVKIISNQFKWDKSGNAIGYKNKIIHVFNKNETSIKNFPKIYNKIKNKKNIILLGDSLGDVKMSEGSEYINILKIGFLNEDKEKLLKSYKEKYDIIITGDSDFKFINKILKIINNK